MPAQINEKIYYSENLNGRHHLKECQGELLHGPVRWWALGIKLTSLSGLPIKIQFLKRSLDYIVIDFV
jgi:hypothetical protein